MDFHSRAASAGVWPRNQRLVLLYGPCGREGLNNYNNNHNDIYSAVIYGASHMREFTVVHLGENQSAPGGRQLVAQAANLTYESARRQNIHLSPFVLLLNHKVDTHLPSLRG